MASPLLEVKDISVSYGDIRALTNVSIEVEQGAIVALVGANGAGKSTLLKMIAGLLQTSQGQILFMGNDLKKLSIKQRVERGIVLVPEGRRLFQTLSVVDNLKLGAYLRKARASYSGSLERVLTMFPVLRERKEGAAGLLSGGEQQMLAIGRAMMAHPKMVMIDEASLGLSPLLTKSIFDLIVALNQEQGTTVLLVEQNIHMALGVCDKGYVMETGQVVMTGTGQELLSNEDVRKAYIGERGSQLR